MEAINLYIQGGLPARAALLVNTHQLSYRQDVLEKIAAALQNAGMHERAGEFFEKMDMLQRAMDA
jgi:intraflagellar transport protein 172